MTFYALVMEPFGFLISSIMAMVLLSLQMGNRSVWQIALLSCLSPILLYLAATRLLAVSLPELNLIELAYARLLGE
jgi:putative tricarboxylic transport membrane protein